MVDPEGTLQIADVPDISVIIPTYNRSSLLKQAIDSCLAQQDVSLEILVIDDASTDETPALIAEYGKKVNCVRLASNHGSGSHGRNVGIPLAAGKYVKFLDHDDVLEPNSLACEYSIALENDADMVMSRWGVYSIDSAGVRIPETERIYEPPASDDVVDAILEGRKVPYTSAVLYKRTYIADMRWDQAVTIIDDFDWFCRAALRGGKIAVAPVVAYWWRLHPQSIQASQADNPLNFLESAYIRNYIYQKVEVLLIERNELTDKRRKSLAQIYYSGLRAFGRFDSERYRATLHHILELDRDFVPNERSEYNPLIRSLSRLFGIRFSVSAYVLVRRSLDFFFPKKGRMSYFSATQVKK